MVVLLVVLVVMVFVLACMRGQGKGGVELGVCVLCVAKESSETTCEQHSMSNGSAKHQVKLESQCQIQHRNGSASVKCQCLYELVKRRRAVVNRLFERKLVDHFI